MWQLTVKMLWRRLRSQTAFNLLNIIGLSLGLGAFLLLSAYVMYELSYDRAYDDSGRIHRVQYEMHNRGEIVPIALSQPGLINYLLDELPGLETFTRWSGSSPNMRVNGTVMKVEEFAYVDTTFFETFGLDLVYGDPDEVLRQENTLALSRSFAETHYPGIDPVGQEIERNGETYTITGVFEDLPDPSHLTLDVAAPFHHTGMAGRTTLTGDLNAYTYLKLREGQSAEEFEALLVDLMEREANEKLRDRGLAFLPHLMPLTGIHLNSHAQYEVSVNGRMEYVILFGVIGLFVLGIAGINFMNLSTARAAGRAKEVGVSKVLGANRQMLIRHFMTESVFFALVSLAVASLLILAFLPVFNHITARDIAWSDIYTPVTIPLMVVLAVVLGLLSGSYPALMLSSFKPVSVLKGRIRQGAQGARFRGALVVLQFSLSIAMIVGTMIVLRQMHFIQTKDLGYDREHVYVVRLHDNELREAYREMRDRFAQVTGVQAATASQHLIGSQVSGQAYTAGDANVEDQVMSWQIGVDQHFIDAMGMELLEGRNFRAGEIADSFTAALIDERFLERIGWEQPVGQFLEKKDDEGTIWQRMEVVGLVRSFHFRSLHKSLEPVVITPMYLDRANHIYLRLDGARLTETVSAVAREWKRFAPDTPLDAFFLDEAFNRQYRQEQRTAVMFSWFAGLAIAIACLGLYGLAAFTAERRTKEIGIRKVLGATAPQMVWLLGREFAVWVLVANVIAIPLSLWGMRSWLEGFAYRIELTPDIFVAAAGLAFLIAMGTVASQALRAANTDPSRALRYE